MAGPARYALLAAAALAAAALAAAPAEACFDPANELAIIHSAPPAKVQPGVLVAKVEFEKDFVPEGFGRVSSEARIIRVVAGSPVIAAARMPVVTSIETTCDNPFANGQKGYLVARLVMEQDRAVLVPLWARRGDGFRLP